MTYESNVRGNQAHSYDDIAEGILREEVFAVLTIIMQVEAT